jgi:D-amino-acid dehydrogenase
MVSPNPSFETLAPLQALPEAGRRRVVVIGAGIVGLSCALWLQRAGHAVTVCDPTPPLPGVGYEAAASFGNSCTIAYGAVLPVAMPGITAAVPRMLSDRDGPLSLFWGDVPGLLPWLWSFIRASRPSEVRRITAVLGQLVRLTAAGLEPLIEQAGLEARVRRTGCLYVYRTAAQFEAAQANLQMRAEQGVRMQVLQAAQLREEEPGLKPEYARAVRFLDTCSLDDPHHFMMGLAQDFQRRGGTVVQASVEAVTRQGGARLAMSGGQAVARGDVIVIAAGAHSGRLAAGLGDRMRLDAERGYHVLFPEDGHRLNSPVCDPESGFYLTPLGEGLRAAGTVELGGLGKPLRPHRTAMIERVSRRLIKDLGPAGRTWLGFRPSMPDSLPVIGPSPSDPQVIHAFGHGHVGLTLGGITGRLVAELASGLPTSMDLAPLAPCRL